MKMGLTKRQRDCLNFIEVRFQETGVPPSYDEMKDHLGLRSKSGIHRLVLALEERGCITRIPERARAISPTLRDTAISIMLPINLEDRLRSVAAASKMTPTEFVFKIVKDRLIIANWRR